MSSARLLPLVARLHSDSLHQEALLNVVAPIQPAEWPALLRQLEQHGLGPLAYKHLQAAQIPLPPDIKHNLQGIYLRHRQANRVRAGELADLLTRFAQADIPALVLKGSALAQIAYPDSGLRPMGDMDILVPPNKAVQAQRLLLAQGFQAPYPKDNRLPDKHFVAAVRQREGLSVQVELHHNLFNQAHRHSRTYADLAPHALPVELPGYRAHTLGHSDMLFHLCNHILYHTHVWLPTRLIWVVDIVAFAEKFRQEIDWLALRQQHPFILRMLSVLHAITPLSPQLRQHLKLNIGPQPDTLDLDFHGWPDTSLKAQHSKGYLGILSDTFRPPELWLRLHYGLSSTTPLFWTHVFRHPLHIFGWVADYLWGRIRGKMRSP